MTEEGPKWMAEGEEERPAPPPVREYTEVRGVCVYVCVCVCVCVRRAAAIPAVL